MGGLGARRAPCAICPHACQLAEGQTGLCHGRVAVGGEVVDANYGRVTALTTVRQLAAIARRHLKHVYVGNC